MTVTIINTTLDGRSVAKCSYGPTVNASGVRWLQFTFTGFSGISGIYDVMVTATSPKTTGGAFSNPSISGNVVGVTLENLAAGSTLSAEMIALVF